MGWRIIQQPNELYSRFSEIVDDFTGYDMNSEEVINLCMTNYGLSQIDAEGKLQRAIENPHRWQEAMHSVQAVHGKKRADKIREELGITHD